MWITNNMILETQPRLYEMQTDGGDYRRNRRQLIPLPQLKSEEIGDRVHTETNQPGSMTPQTVPPASETIANVFSMLLNQQMDRSKQELNASPRKRSDTQTTLSYTNWKGRCSDVYYHACIGIHDNCYECVPRVVLPLL